MFSIKKLVVSIENLLLLIIFLMYIPCTLPQVRKEQLRQYNDTTEALRVRNIIPVDVRSYVDAGGTFHGLINQAGSNEVTLIISDTVTATASIPTNITLNFTGEGLLVKPSGSMYISGDIIAQRKKIFEGNIDISLSKVSEVYPEWYGAQANDAVDDKDAVENTIKNSLGKKISFVPYGQYQISDTINVYLDGKSLNIYGGDGTEIISNKHVDSYSYSNNPGILRLRGGDVVDIRDIYFKGANEGTWSQSDNVLVVEDCYNVIMEKVKVTDAAYSGVRLQNINHLGVYNCTSEYNMYAGTMIVASKHTNVVGGSYSYNGSVPFENGYGISFSHQYGTGINNEDISIQGIQANYNLRKGIDVHGGVNILITKNFIKGFVYSAINPVHEGGLNNYFNTTRSVEISSNIIENDSAWFASLNYGAYTPYSIPIQFGSYHLRDTSDYGQLYAPIPGYGEDTIVGSWIVTKNQLKNCSVGEGGNNRLVALINGFGGKAESMIISENALERSRPINAIYIGSGNEYGGQPKNLKVKGNTLAQIRSETQMFLITSGRNIEIAENSFDSCSIADSAYGIGIHVFPYGPGADIQFVNIHNNTFTAGAYTRAYPITWILVANSINQSLHDNYVYGMLNQRVNDASVSCRLPDMLTKSKGEAKYVIEIGEFSPDTIKTLFVPAYTYPDGNAEFTITVSTTFTSNPMFRAIYRFSAWARNNGGTSWTFSQERNEYDVTDYDDAAYRPSIFWSGTDSSKTLMVLCPQQWSTYDVDIKFRCWRLTPYQREEL